MDVTRFADPCLPTRAKAAPSGPMWLHEIKHDGYRLMVRRTAENVRIKTRRGFGWTDRFPLISEAAAQLGATPFVIDGEGVILRADGVSDFDRMHARRHDGEVQLLGFDVLELDGDDLRQEPLDRREAAFARLLRRSHAAIQMVEHIEATDGSIVFEHTCRLRLEGIDQDSLTGSMVSGQKKTGGVCCITGVSTGVPPLKSLSPQKVQRPLDAETDVVGEGAGGREAPRVCT